MMLSATNALKSKSINLWVVFEEVRRNGPLPRIRISDATGLSRQATSDIVEELIDLGFLRQEKTRVRQVGKPPVPIALNPKGGFSFGFHVDEGRLAYVEQNLLGEVIRSGDLAIARMDIEEISDLIKEQTISMIESTRFKKSHFLGVGLATPGPFGESVIHPPHLVGWDGALLRDHLGRNLEYPVILANEGQCAITAEAYFGETASKYTDFVYISLGKGLGSASMIDRMAFGGAHGNAGEFGHTIVVPNGNKCVCGKRGCLETYVSMTSLKRFLNRQGDPVQSFAELESRYSAEHSLVAEWIQDASEPLRNGLSTLENLFEPETMMFGGDAPNWLIDALFQAVQPLYPSLRRTDSAQPRLIRSEFGADAMPRGAAYLPVLAYLNPRFRASSHRASLFSKPDIDSKVP
ncbi:ROK family transcriptional regulator [Phyllobacterium zundukense]|uniref:ROK family transcriptional regulator n=1 Tax=Phyllobacterium zundukense TaxID=1867719 RepID=A0ACD4CVQ6_9HYPH|nr:ROK family transcriptional regulator [Phyllobacterium zundukense]UXN57665.1 ROK family transcriptional regulator [Phyllobacterium zundukense]